MPLASHLIALLSGIALLAGMAVLTIEHQIRSAVGTYSIVVTSDGGDRLATGWVTITGIKPAIHWDTRFR